MLIGTLWGSGPCGGNPSVACGHPFGNVPYGQPPLSGEARPKSRLRRLAVGAAGAALWRNGLRQGMCRRTWALPSYQAVRPRSKNSGVMVRMGPIAGLHPPNGEAQTAAGVRSSRFLPKTARRAPQALEAGAFWDHRPKSLFIRSLAVLLRKVLAVFLR